MGIPLASLSNQQRSLIGNSDAKALGIIPISTAQAKAERGTELSEQETFRSHLLLHSIEFIQAPPRRKVKDLETGWPDFTLLLPGGRYLLIEFKTRTSKLSVDQERLHARLHSHGLCVHVVYSASEAIQLLSALLPPPLTQYPRSTFSYPLGS